MLKFRTMHVDAERTTGPVWAQRNDPRLTPVGGFLRNVTPFGVKDMCGNVWEWTTTPFAKGSEFKVVRGGSYNDPIGFLSLDIRLDVHPKDKCEAIGVRCVKNIHP